MAEIIHRTKEEIKANKGIPKLYCPTSLEDIEKIEDLGCRAFALRVKMENIAYDLKSSNRRLTESIGK